MTTVQTSWATPISDKNPVGNDLRADEQVDSPYRSMRDYRMAARDQERQLQLGNIDEISNEPWRKLYQLTDDHLINSSKDIELIAWHIEAALRLDGFQGLADSFAKAKSCIATYATALYPQLEADDEPYWQVQALTALNGEDSDGSLIMPLYNISLNEHQPLPIWTYQLRDNSAALLVLEQTATDYLQKLWQQACTARDNFSDLIAELVNVFGDNAPLTDRIERAIEDIITQLAALLAERGVLQTQPIEVDDLSLSESIVEQSSAATANYSRATALNELKKIAGFFRQREPHSPVPYMLERIIAWADLPLPDLLAKMIGNSAELQQVYSLTGIEDTSE